MSTRTPSPRLSIAGGAVALALLSACAGSVPGADDAGTQKDGTSQAQESKAKITSNIRRGARGVDIDRKLRLWVASGTFEEVQVTGPRGGIVKGRLSPNKSRWVSRTP